MRKAILILTCAALTGCAHYTKVLPQSPEKRQAYVEAHPRLPAEVRAAVLDAKWTIGMTTSDLRVARGVPYDISRTVGEWGIHESWEYRNISFSIMHFHFENDTLRSWSEN